MKAKLMHNQYLRNQWIFFFVDGGIHSKNGGKAASCPKRMMHKFSLRFWCGYLHQPKKYYNDSLSLYFNAFKKHSFWLDVSIANDAAIDIAMSTHPGKVKQGLPCQECAFWLMKLGIT